MLGVGRGGGGGRGDAVGMAAGAQFIEGFLEYAS